MDNPSPSRASTRRSRQGALDKLPNLATEAATLRPSAALLLAVLVVFLPACQFLGSPGLSEIYDERLGGDTTAFSSGKNAFELSARNLDTPLRRTFEVGDSFFNQNWVAAPASTEARDGLGPTMNAQSCSSCHSHDGRGRPPENADDPARGLLLRLSVPGPDGPVDEPAYGGQLQDRSILGVPFEGRVAITYREVPGKYPDGTGFSLRHPVYGIGDPQFGPVHPNVMISPRVAPATIGMGLLEAVPEERIMALADPDDADDDGISGRANFVWNIREGKLSLGRFGWKANQPSVEQQSAGAFLGDIGITSSLFPDENCPSAQAACTQAPSGGLPEIPDTRLEKVTIYTQTLAVPAMRNVDDGEVKQGARLFVQSQCSVCHTPRHKTGQDHPLEPLRGQTIYPYTDLLLHDMGDGLADNRPDGLANGSEWRTPPLWGIGLVQTVNGHTMFLHDGRARSLEEAILWHGGEAKASRDKFMGLTLKERNALIKFLESL